MLEAQMHHNFWEFRNLTVKIFKLSPVCPTSTSMFGSQLHQTAFKGISDACYDIFIDHFHSSNEKRTLKQWACSFYFASSLKSFSAFWTHSGSSSSLWSCGERVTFQTFHSEQSVTPPSASVHLLVHGGERQQPYQLWANGHRTAWWDPTGRILQLTCTTAVPSKGNEASLSACQWWGWNRSTSCLTQPGTEALLKGLHNHASVQLRKLWLAGLKFPISAADQSSEAQKMVLVTFRRHAGKQLYKQLPDAFYYPRIQFFNFTADSSMCFFLFLLFAHVVFFCLRDVETQH